VTEPCRNRSSSHALTAINSIINLALFALAVLLILARAFAGH